MPGQPPRTSEIVCFGTRSWSSVSRLARPRGATSHVTSDSDSAVASSSGGEARRCAAQALDQLGVEVHREGEVETPLGPGNARGHAWFLGSAAAFDVLDRRHQSDVIAEHPLLVHLEDDPLRRVGRGTAANTAGEDQWERCMSSGT